MEDDGGIYGGVGMGLSVMDLETSPLGIWISGIFSDVMYTWRVWIGGEVGLSFNQRDKRWVIVSKPRLNHGRLCHGITWIQ